MPSEEQLAQGRRHADATLQTIKNREAGIAF